MTAALVAEFLAELLKLGVSLLGRKDPLVAVRAARTAADYEAERERIDAAEMKARFGDG